MIQGELFERPKKRGRRGWTDLDRLRARVERLSRRIEETGGSEKDMEDLKEAKVLLIQRYEEAKEKWKRCFGS